MIITRTPVRVSFLGGGLDFPCWFQKNEGLVVGCAINQYSYISARFLPRFHEYKSRIVYSTMETVQNNVDIQHRAVRACIEHLNLSREGLEVFHASDLPGRSGTGSSSTFVVGLLNALATLKGQHLFPADVAATATHIERDVLKETVGCQDQVWASHGGANIIKFRRDGEISISPLALPAEKVEDLEAHLMLFFTRIQRTSSDIASTYAHTLGERGAEQWAMTRLVEQGIEAIYASKWEQLGKLIDQSWRIKAGLAEGVSTEAISQLYNVARISGAFGGKITGAGGGGCLMLVAPPEKQKNIIVKLEELGCIHIPFRVDFDGSRVIFAQR